MPDPLTLLAIGSGITGGLSSIFGGRAKRKANKRAMRFQRETRDKLLELNEPFRQQNLEGNEIRLEAMRELASLFEGGGDFQSLIDSEPIQFLRGQGEQAIARRFNAAGQGGGTGRELAELVDFNQGLASTAIQELALNPLFRLAGISAPGQAGSAAVNQAVAGTGTNLAQLAVNQGQARASTFGGINDAFQGTAGNLAFLTGFGQPQRNQFTPDGFTGMSGLLGLR